MDSLVPTPCVWVAYADQTGQYLVELPWHASLTAQQALDQSGLRAKLIPDVPIHCGIFGNKIENPADYLLTAGDRLEIYRPLTRDPKDVRRRRAQANPVGRFRRQL